MSRGFVKEDDQEEAPFIPPRAPLPEGAINYVTVRGMRLLEEERNSLELERKEIIDKAEAGRMGDDERRRDLAVINGKLDLLLERIATARVVEQEEETQEVRFGTTITFIHKAGPQKGKSFTFTIVGVDEADVKEGRIAFTAPISRTLNGRRAGDLVEFKLGPQVQQLEILSVT